MHAIPPPLHPIRLFQVNNTLLYKKIINGNIAKKNNNNNKMRWMKVVKRKLSAEIDTRTNLPFIKLNLEIL